MTSNVGTDKITNENPLGFGSANRQDNTEKIVLKELEKRFKPEMLNRIDEKVVFNKLKKESILEIVNIELKLLVKRLEDKKYYATIDDSLKEFLAEEGYDEKNGARPLKRAITKYVETVISNGILHGSINKDDKIELSYDANKKEVKVEKK